MYTGQVTFNRIPEQNGHVYLVTLYFLDNVFIDHIDFVQDREFTGKVVEIINGDALMVKVGKAFKKIHLASIRYKKIKL